ncbi:transglycosylase domain-containing protein [Paenibacillus sp. P96]|uniref:Transglycosylase domain-containing protein n=1 Tax=Paenibacillus zeirhizosphaerae TaxID=2987519 RepID=A0ABT9FQZ3_9BACL|nr:transglycosylase domain-containing protein [Paenibacillus sp. P96]MDP4096852.1 transglycosylase domain-containing protein [Paenibacillus sp. P96]
MVDEKKIPPDRQGSRARTIFRRTGITLKWLLVLGCMGILFAGGAVSGYVASIVKDEPVRSRETIEQKVGENAITGFAYFEDGAPIGQLRTEEDRRPVTYEQIPQIVIDAVVAIEDNRFYEHQGVDFSGTMRAVKQKVLNESVQTGGSTLTQQLARRVFLNLDRTEDRKVKEILLAMRLERFMTKEQIMTAYLNKVPFGNGSNGYNVFGIKAAAKGIFNITDLNKLNIAQAAYLAGLPQLPSTYSAFNGKGEFNESAFNKALNRQKLVLSRMLEEGKINSSQYDEALAFDIKKSLAKRTVKAYNTYPYLMMETERQASQILMSLQQGTDLQAGQETGEAAGTNQLDQEEALQQLRTGGYRIYTTIDKTVYKTMRDIAENANNFSPTSQTKGMEQTAAMLINHKTGAILGMIEGRDFNEEQMNYATQMVRQPGSAMKPLAAYLPALEAGLVQPGSVLDDAPIILKDGVNGFHIPKNSNNRYEGLVTARHALNKSINTVALKLFNEKVGIDKAWAFVKKLGITTIEDSDYQASTGVLGGLKYGVTVEELTNAYGAIANGGEFNDAYMISKIVDSKGNIVYKHEARPVKAFSPQTAYLMTDMLSTVVKDGTGTLVNRNFKHNDIPIVGKTGTTQSYTDVWFEGFTPDVTLGVWVGYKQQIHKLETSEQKERARRLWATIMNEVVDSDPQLFKDHEFEKPDGIVSRTVSAYSGKLPTSLTNRFVTDIFNTKYVPTESDDGVARAKYITYNGVNYIPRDGTPAEFLGEQTVIKREKPISELIKELQNAFSKMKEHNSLSYYLPADADNELPTRVDPRKDNGRDPEPPSNVQASLDYGNAVISFAASGDDDVVGYRLYRSSGDGNFSSTGKIVRAGNSRVFTDSPGEFYVTAVDVAGRESAPSSSVSATEAPDPTLETPEGAAGALPSAPGQPAAEATADGTRLQWGGNAPEQNVIGYNVYYSGNGQEPFNLIGSSRSTQYDSKVKGWFRITAVNVAGESPPSSPVQKN